ncbi:MAG TPA: alpha-amylase/4-alpha-glucanotransferase domain-containing protein [Gemmataceae bacterium]|nr:alpha-amylase/4-alpha-glucanotransferase domain-containing protein [Gemmataceae bacterium]
MALRFVFALHNHQPVGNFDSVFERAYCDGYRPFLDLFEQYPEIPFSLHTSGCLMEWLVERKPEYVERLRGLVARGQVEIMGGGFYEPILPMIPAHDRVGQIRTYRDYLENLFATKVRGMWVPERVWEQNLVADIAAAGMEYTVLDDFHFKQAGLEERQLFGYYVTEDEGRLLRIFPGSERMRYLVPFRNPEETIAYFGEVASQNPDAIIVFADDGEKFGSWPETHRHCYQDGWLRRFLDALRYAGGWVRFCTFAQALDQTRPAGKVYLPDCSYREMTEWALPVEKLITYRRLLRDLEHDPRKQEIQRFLRGGYWRNFKVKYPETQEMYGRMLEVSQRLQEPNEMPEKSLSRARQELYRAQCNCAWWHGAFGGLYLPHLRNAVYQHLIAAENMFLEHTRQDECWVELDRTDLNLDGAPEVCLRNSKMAAYLNPQSGGSLYELDVRGVRHNLLATLARRPEVYHEAIRQQTQIGGSQGSQERVVFKQAGLDRLLQYDAYLRKSLIDHFYEAQVTLEQLAGCQEIELGDFVTGEYEQRVEKNGNEVRVTQQRSGQAAGCSVRVSKEICLRATADVVEIAYRLENLPRSRGPQGLLHFAIEFNFAGMAAGADDRYFYYDGQQRAGQLQTQQSLANISLIGLVDEWLGLDVSLTLSRPGGIWTFPVQTVSQSEGGCELVHQSSAVIPHWLIEPDGTGRWEVHLSLRLDISRAEKQAKTSANM